NGILDLIVADTGSNNVLVYPGLGNGQFGAPLNGPYGFFTGTNPVGITVADINGDGRPDLIVANKGSNDVAILFTQTTSNGGFTFVPGPRLQAGNGPVATVVTSVTNAGVARGGVSALRPANTTAGSSGLALFILDSGSNDVRMLPGIGNGFFND